METGKVKIFNVDAYNGRNLETSVKISKLSMDLAKVTESILKVANEIDGYI
jgi:hypothetical protein